LTGSVAALVSFFKWTERAGDQQESLKRALWMWFNRAQKAAKIVDSDDAIETMAKEELEPMLSERIEKWQKELIDEGEAKGRAEGEAGFLIRLCEQKLGPLSRDVKDLIRSADSDQLLAWGERLIDAKSLDDLVNP
jgi:hypothetical protein